MDGIFDAYRPGVLLQSFDLVELENDLFVSNSELHKLHILCTRVCCRHHAWCNTGDDHSEYTTSGSLLSCWLYHCNFLLVHHQTCSLILKNFII